METLESKVNYRALSWKHFVHGCGVFECKRDYRKYNFEKMHKNPSAEASCCDWDAEIRRMKFLMAYNISVGFTALFWIGNYM